jgi:hypothetical protein
LLKNNFFVGKNPSGKHVNEGRNEWIRSIGENVSKAQFALNGRKRFVLSHNMLPEANINTLTREHASINLPQASFLSICHLSQQRNSKKTDRDLHNASTAYLQDKTLWLLKIGHQLRRMQASIQH